MNSPRAQVNELGEKDECAEAVWLGKEDLKNDGKLVGWFTGNEVSLIIYSVKLRTHLA